MCQLSGLPVGRHYKVCKSVHCYKSDRIVDVAGAYNPDKVQAGGTWVGMSVHIYAHTPFRRHFSYTATETDNQLTGEDNIIIMFGMSRYIYAHTPFHRHFGYAPYLI